MKGRKAVLGEHATPLFQDLENQTARKATNLFDLHEPNDSGNE